MIWNVYMALSCDVYHSLLLCKQSQSTDHTSPADYPLPREGISCRIHSFVRYYCPFEGTVPSVWLKAGLNSDCSYSPVSQVCSIVLEPWSSLISN